MRSLATLCCESDCCYAREIGIADELLIVDAEKAVRSGPRCDCILLFFKDHELLKALAVELKNIKEETFEKLLEGEGSAAEVKKRIKDFLIKELKICQKLEACRSLLKERKLREGERLFEAILVMPKESVDFVKEIFLSRGGKLVETVDILLAIPEDHLECENFYVSLGKCMTIPEGF